MDDKNMPWSIQELVIFLAAFRSVPRLHSSQILQQLHAKGYYNRTLSHIDTLHNQHKNFLTLNQQCTAQGLYAVIQDRTNALKLGIQQARKKSRRMQVEEPMRKKIDSKKDLKGAKKVKFRFKRKFEGVAPPKLPTKPAQRFKLLQANLTEQVGCLKKARQSCEVINPWWFMLMQSEYFVPTLDQVYFKTNQFRQILKQAKIEFEKGLTRSQWKLIRKKIGQPRLFSYGFLSSQLSRLEASRNVCRHFMRDKDPEFLSKLQEDSESFQLLKMVKVFQVNQIVIAKHPVCLHLHYGLIFSKTKENNLMIRFMAPELGVQKIADHLVSLNLLEGCSFSQRDSPPAKSVSQISSIVSELDFQSTAFTFKLLQSKHSCINYLNENKLSMTQEEKEWMSRQITILNQSIRSAMTKFRLRGQKSTSLRGQVIPKLMANNLKHFQRDIETNQVTNTIAIQRAKSVLANFQDNQIQSTLSRLLPEGHEGGLVEALGGILVSLKVGGRQVRECRYFKKLVEMVFDKYPQHLNEINDLVFSINSKLK